MSFYNYCQLLNERKFCCTFCIVENYVFMKVNIIFILAKYYLAFMFNWSKTSITTQQYRLDKKHFLTIIVQQILINQSINEQTNEKQFT